VWADSQSADFISSANNQFLIRAGGGVGINTNNPNGAALNANGVIVATGFQINASSGSFIGGGGPGNSTAGNYNAIGGGNANATSGDQATVSGGAGNSAKGNQSPVHGKTPSFPSLPSVMQSGWDF